MSRRALAGIAAVLIGIAGTTTVALYARQADARALAGQEAVRVFVVNKEVPAGTTAAQAVKDGLIKQELIARKAVPDDALAEVGSDYGQLVAAATLQPGSLVLRPSFSARAAREGGLAVPAGKFAVSLVLDDPGHVGAFVGVGSHVAVFDTFKVKEIVDPHKASAKTKQELKLSKDADMDDDWTGTRVLLPDIEVLAVGTTAVATSAARTDDTPNKVTDPQGQGPSLLVTVAATQAEAEKLIHVGRTGTLTFALLGPDAKAEMGVGVEDHRLFPGYMQ